MEINGEICGGMLEFTDVCLCIADVFSQAPWLELRKLQDPTLQELAGKLPNTVLADSTTKKYLGAFRRWKSWAVQHQLPVLPAKEAHVALYLQHIGETVQSKSAAEEACNALAWIHSTAGLMSPVGSPLVKATLQGLQRMLARPVHKKAPATARMLEQMVDDARQSGTLADMQLTTACLVAFAGFLRFSELIQLKTSDISIREDAMVIKNPHSKTDQLRKGDEVIFARSGKATCPVTYLENYLRRSGTSLQEQRFVFRPICKSKMGEHLRESGSISYTCLWEQFKSKIRKLGYNPTDFGLHSLRAGGATMAANVGVPDRLFKRHGRWKSEKAKGGYVDDSVERRLSVTRQLDL